MITSAFSVLILICLKILLLLRVGADTAGTDFVPGEAIHEAVHDNDKIRGSIHQNDNDGDDGIDVCQDRHCIHLVWIVPSVVLLALWMGSLTLTVPDYIRESRYINEIQKAFELHPVACDSEELPPSGSWTLTCGFLTTTLALKFGIDGTFEGEGDGRFGYFTVLNGRFDHQTGKFSWEEVIHETRERRLFTCCKYLFRLIVRGPCILFMPIECKRRREWTSFANSPRTLWIATGGQVEHGSWKLDCTYITCDQRHKWCDLELSEGGGLLRNLTDEELAEVTPPDSPQLEGRPSVKHQSHLTKQAVRNSIRLSQDLQASSSADVFGNLSARQISIVSAI